MAAERIHVSYSVLERSISINSLETYARTGVIKDDLAAYAEYVEPGQLQQFRSVLLSRIDLSPVAISQFLYTPIGENLLQRLGQVIQVDSGLSGFYAIRSALILSAADADGLTLLNVLKKFPSRELRINVARSLEIAGVLQQFIQQTNQAQAAIFRVAATEATTIPVIPFKDQPDLRNRGPYTWKQRTIVLNDLSRQRTYPADIYLPQGQRSQDAPQPPYPVIVISHGVGSDRSTLAYLAQQLASYGFAVAVPEHLGSNARQLSALISGRASEVVEPSEFIDRPLDIRFLLDELEQLSQGVSEYRGLLNTRQVGIVGQSFGGYTALVVVSPGINFSRLQQACPPGADSLNLSLLLQCLATQVNASRILYDSRIKATIAINPVAGTVLGKESLSKIQVPVMVVTGLADTVTPALPEQLFPFTWLTTTHRYLAAVKGGTHFSMIAEAGPAGGPVPIPDALVGPNPRIARRYMNALTVAFFQTYVAGRSEYRAYLTAAYADFLSQGPLDLHLVQSLTTAQLEQAIGGSVQ
ncbi:alpha/beta hydrolase [Leptolyngbya sp. 'hensonii']|uniref:alpha/beta hydrolase n=1 Tax=Leptolyngbya sp. 'hensonii' TaxID=1922337 RepID=UPI001C0D04FC|nr:alpha/beta hydrolase [Leptolyngbya sp. 'hensonii']